MSVMVPGLGVRKNDVRRGLPWPHNPGCACDVTQTFTCERCGRRFGYCFGAHDDMPEACDFCWEAAHVEDGSGR